MCAGAHERESSKGTAHTKPEMRSISGGRRTQTPQAPPRTNAPECTKPRHGLNSDRPLTSFKGTRRIGSSGGIPNEVAGAVMHRSDVWGDQRRTVCPHSLGARLD